MAGRCTHRNPRCPSGVSGQVGWAATTGYTDFETFPTPGRSSWPLQSRVQLSRDGAHISRLFSVRITSQLAYSVRLHQLSADQSRPQDGIRWRNVRAETETRTQHPWPCAR